MQDEVLEIHVLPPKPYQFSSAQPRECIQLDHRAEWIWQFLEECHDFFRRQNIWCFLPFELWRTLVIGFSVRSHLIA